MRIPRIPVGQHQGTNWSTTNDAGKGSWPPRNLGHRFDENFVGIRWDKDQQPTPGDSAAEIRSRAVHTRTTHRGGSKIEVIRTLNDDRFQITTHPDKTVEVVSLEK